MINENQITMNQLFCSTEKINLKRKIVSTVTVKNLIRQKIRKDEKIYTFSNFEKLKKSKNRV